MVRYGGWPANCNRLQWRPSLAHCAVDPGDFLDPARARAARSRRRIGRCARRHGRLERVRREGRRRVHANHDRDGRDLDLSSVLRPSFGRITAAIDSARDSSDAARSSSCRRTRRNRPSRAARAAPARRRPAPTTGAANPRRADRRLRPEPAADGRRLHLPKPAADRVRRSCRVTAGVPIDDSCNLLPRSLPPCS